MFDGFESFTSRFEQSSEDQNRRFSDLDLAAEVKSEGNLKSHNRKAGEEVVGLSEKSGTLDKDERAMVRQDKEIDRKEKHLSHKEQQAATLAKDYEHVGKLLSTGELPPINKEQAQHLLKTIHDADIDLSADAHLEVATPFGFKSVGWNELVEVATRIRPIPKEEKQLDIRQLNLSSERLNFALLAALISSYREKFPGKSFRDLPLDDMKALYDGFLEATTKEVLGVGAGMNYKWAQLEAVAVDFLDFADTARKMDDTQLFTPVLNATVTRKSEIESARSG